MAGPQKKTPISVLEGEWDIIIRVLGKLVPQLELSILTFLRDRSDESFSLRESKILLTRHIV
jgi:hypothetical protein